MKRTMLLITVAAALAAPAAAPAATTLGDTSGSTNSCSENESYTQGLLASGPSYVAAAPGVIVSWSTQVAANPVVGRLLVLKPGAGSTLFVPAQIDADRAFSNLNQVNTVTGLHIPIAGGERIGVYIPIGSNFRCELLLATGSSTLYTGDGAPALGSPLDFSGEDGDTKPNISALVEPDADHDGFGDETQDGCPAQAATHGPCVVVKKKKCKKKKKKHRSATAAKKKKHCKKKRKK
jgi:hypothetical protein